MRDLYRAILDTATDKIALTEKKRDEREMTDTYTLTLTQLELLVVAKKSNKGILEWLG